MRYRKFGENETPRVAPMQKYAKVQIKIISLARWELNSP